MMTNREIAEYTLEQLKKHGAEAAQCRVGRGKTDELNVDGGQFSLMRSLLDTSLGMRALVGGKKGTAAINTLDKASIDEAVAACIAAAQSAVADEAEIIAPNQGEKHFEDGPFEADREKLFDRIEEFMAAVQADYPKIIMEQLIAKHSLGDILYMNTNGTVFTHRVGGYGVETMFSAHEGEKTSSFNGYDISLDSLDAPLMESGMLRTMLDESQRSLDTCSVDGKFTGRVLVTPSAMMDIMMAVFSNTLSDSVIIDGTSAWKDKLGQVVASGGLTMGSAPLDAGVVGGERFTADGYLSENYDFIKDGVLQSFGLSQYGALKTGNKRAANSAMNLVIAPGADSYGDLLAKVGKGLVLNRFSGGAPATNGEFSGVAKNSFLVENGKVGSAVSETMISGNLLEMLKSIVGISRERVSDGNTLLPWIVFDGVTISGK